MQFSCNTITLPGVYIFRNLINLTFYFILYCILLLYFAIVSSCVLPWHLPLLVQWAGTQVNQHIYHFIAFAYTCTFQTSWSESELMLCCHCTSIQPNRNVGLEWHSYRLDVVSYLLTILHGVNCAFGLIFSDTSIWFDMYVKSWQVMDTTQGCENGNVSWICLFNFKRTSCISFIRLWKYSKE